MIENSELLMEMSCKSKKRTGLPVIIWIDEGQTYKDSKRGQRIKVQGDYADHSKNGAELFDLTLDGETYPKGIENNYEIKKKDLQKVKNYVKNNKYALEKVGDCEIFLDDIFPYMIKGGELADEERVEELKRKVDELIDDENIQSFEEIIDEIKRMDY